jgi:hypothetical protein
MDRKPRIYTPEEIRAREAMAFAALRAVRARPKQESTQHEGQQEQAKAGTEASTKDCNEKSTDEEG